MISIRVDRKYCFVVVVVVVVVVFFFIVIVIVADRSLSSQEKAKFFADVLMAMI